MFEYFRKKGKGGAGGSGSLSSRQNARIIDEGIAEMLGVIRRVLADGVVTEDEAAALSAWTADHPEVVQAWPGKVLAHRLRKIISDGRVDAVEREDLKRLLRALAGGSWGVRAVGEASAIPFTDPPPVLVFPEQTFVLVGEFAYGPLSACEAAVESMGGRTDGAVNRDVDILVIGTFGQESWEGSMEAREVERAVELRKGGHPIAIVSEDYWASALPI